MLEIIFQIYVDCGCKGWDTRDLRLLTLVTCDSDTFDNCDIFNTRDTQERSESTRESRVEMYMDEAAVVFIVVDGGDGDEENGEEGIHQRCTWTRRRHYCCLAKDPPASWHLPFLDDRHHVVIRKCLLPVKKDLAWLLHRVVAENLCFNLFQLLVGGTGGQLLDPDLN